MTAAVLAIGCLVITGFLDLLFKLYSSKPRSRGMLVSGIGLIWLALQTVAMALEGESLQLDEENGPHIPSYSRTL